MLDEGKCTSRGAVVDVTSLSIPGGWTEKSIRLNASPAAPGAEPGNARLLTFALPANPDEFLEHLESLPDFLGGADPYWARLWPTSLTMAEWVAKQTWPPGQSALELGCGIGIVGMAGLLSGLAVTFSDYVPIAVELAVQNARRNGLLHAHRLLLDWRSPQAGQYAVILAADVLYDCKLYEPLLDLLDAMLDDSGVCWIADPGRYHCELFVGSARQRGYQIWLRDAACELVSRPVAGEFLLIELR